MIYKTMYSNWYFLIDWTFFNKCKSKTNLNNNKGHFVSVQIAWNYKTIDHRMQLNDGLHPTPTRGCKLWLVLQKNGREQIILFYTIIHKSFYLTISHTNVFHITRGSWSQSSAIFELYADKYYDDYSDPNYAEHSL